MSAAGLLRGIFLSTLLINVANEHSCARAEALSRAVPRERIAPVIDVSKLPAKTEDGRTISKNPTHHVQNALEKRIRRGEIPPPENISLGKLKAVAGKLAALNANDLGSWAGLARLSRETHTSPSQIRAICAYLEEHGHALNLSRIRSDDRKIAGAREPDPDASRTTVRLVFAITCEQAETLTEDQVLDLIALGDERPRVKHPAPDASTSTPAATRIEPVRAESPAARAPVPAPTVRELAPELRCLVEPLAATSTITGYDLPIEWVADEADRAGLEDLQHAADAVCELNERLLEERRGAEAMGEKCPKIKSGAVRLRTRVVSFLRGKRTWLSSGAETFRLRDEAREREEQHEATLTPEQRERRGLHEVHATRKALPVPVLGVPKPAPPTAHEHAVMRLHNRIGALGARIATAQTAAEKADLERQLAGLRHELTELVDGGKKPPE